MCFCIVFVGFIWITFNRVNCRCNGDKRSMIEIIKTIIPFEDDSKVPHVQYLCKYIGT